MKWSCLRLPLQTTSGMRLITQEIYFRYLIIQDLQGNIFVSSVIQTLYLVENPLLHSHKDHITRAGGGGISEIQGTI